MRLHLRQILSMLMRAGWKPDDAKARVALFASMGARVALVAALGGCAPDIGCNALPVYSLPSVYYVPPSMSCNPGDTDEGIVMVAKDTRRKCRRVQP